ncbi:MAG: WG repeat-containing protein, partial [Neisseriaceae bacterium]|nr:WG repeat-containing protein [Neisseriaceae bacterium]
LVIPAKYDWADPFYDGLAQVKINNKWGFINKTGELVIPAQYDSDSVDNFHDGLARVKIDNKWGFINKTGELVIPAQYDWADSFHDGLAQVTIDGKEGFINKSGKMVFNITEQSEKRKTKLEQQEYARKSKCEHLYVGKVVEMPVTGFFGDVRNQDFEVMGFSPKTGKATLKWLSVRYGHRQETYCSDIPE